MYALESLCSLFLRSSGTCVLCACVHVHVCVHVSVCACACTCACHVLMCICECMCVRVRVHARVRVRVSCVYARCLLRCVPADKTLCCIWLQQRGEPGGAALAPRLKPHARGMGAAHTWQTRRCGNRTAQRAGEGVQGQEGAANSTTSRRGSAGCGVHGYVN